MGVVYFQFAADSIIIPFVNNFIFPQQLYPANSSTWRKNVNLAAWIFIVYRSVAHVPWHKANVKLNNCDDTIRRVKNIGGELVGRHILHGYISTQWATLHGEKVATWTKVSTVLRVGVLGRMRWRPASNVTYHDAQDYRCTRA